MRLKNTDCKGTKKENSVLAFFIEVAISQSSPPFFKIDRKSTYNNLYFKINSYQVNMNLFRFDANVIFSILIIIKSLLHRDTDFRNQLINNLLFVSRLIIYQADFSVRKRLDKP